VGFIPASQEPAKVCIFEQTLARRSGKIRVAVWTGCCWTGVVSDEKKKDEPEVLARAGGSLMYVSRGLC
jgi:hypothetical protein